MLGKLMKHELRATSRTMLPLLLLTLLLSVFVRMTSVVVEKTHANFIELIHALLIFAFVLALIGTAVFSVVLMVLRFRNNLMTDEGYLMFTLPVNVHQLLWSKLLVSSLWFVAVFLTDALSVFLVFFRSRMLEELPAFFRALSQQMTSYYAVNGALFALELFAVVLAGMLTACLLFYAPLAIGNSFATHKTLLSVVFYFVIQTVLQLVSVFGFAASSRVFYPLFESVFAESVIKAVHLVLLSALGYSLIVGAILYILTWFMLRRHLNLQ